MPATGTPLNAAWIFLLTAAAGVGTGISDNLFWDLELLFATLLLLGFGWPLVLLVVGAALLVAALRRPSE